MVNPHKEADKPNYIGIDIGGLLLLQQQVNAMMVGSTLKLGLAVSGESAPLIGAELLLGVPEETILH